MAEDDYADFKKAHAVVLQLVRNFDDGEALYRSASYSEQQARIDFIDKFWSALGWDVVHQHQLNPYEQEVKIEKNVIDQGRGRRADYAFLQPNYRDVRFFVEAKRPGTEIDTADNFFQVVRYGWNSSVPLSVLTSFAEFRVLDCRYKPDISAAHQRVIPALSFRYKQFEDEQVFAKIYFLFSRKASLARSIEKYADTLVKPAGKAIQRGLFSSLKEQTMDDAFLEELDTARESLARSFKHGNPTLNGEQLSELTQRTLDRFVFMRFLEDKLIEPDVIVERLGDRGSVWEDFISVSKRLNALYNGIVFRKHSLLDSPLFKVDESVLEELREALAHTNSPYAFNYVPIHILGNIYERFLSKTIVATQVSASVVAKPENRKKSGVFYTPEHIVRYIVDQTIGTAISNRSPNEIAKLRFADISCGSGSFLISIFDTLLRRHAQFYNEKVNRSEARAAGCVIGRDDGAFHLSLKQKRQILLNNVFGVDIDSQAVEVAQLSLYLKLLEEETTESAHHYQLTFGERLLPDLDNNIKCGNALVEWDIVEKEAFSEDEERVLRPFNFADQFSDIVKAGGFDSIIGNPPYVQLSMKMFREERLNRYLPRKYRVSGGRLNTFAFFLERAQQLCSLGGSFSYILPNTFATQEYYSSLRYNLLHGAVLTKVTATEGSIFRDAVIENIIIVASKKKITSIIPRNQVDFELLKEDGTTQSLSATKQSALALTHKQSFISQADSSMSALQAKLARQSVKLDQLTYINQAIALKEDRAACLTRSKKSGKYHEILDGRHIDRYYVGSSPNFFKYDVEKIHSCKREDIFMQDEKILFRRVGDRLIGALDREHKYALNTIVVVSRRSDCFLDLRFILACFNSRLLNLYYKAFLKSTKKIFSEIQARQVGQLPIPALDLDRKADRVLHDQIVATVDKMLTAKKRMVDSDTEQNRTLTQAKILALDGRLDELVYKAFGLTEQDVRLVEQHA